MIRTGGEKVKAKQRVEGAQKCFLAWRPQIRRVIGKTMDRSR
jgi:hypothetical protein